MSIKADVQPTAQKQPEDPPVEPIIHDDSPPAYQARRQAALDAAAASG